MLKTSARASRIFSELDINGDGELSCDEFIRGCMQVHEYLSWSNYGVYDYNFKGRQHLILWHIKGLIQFLNSGSNNKRE